MIAKKLKKPAPAAPESNVNRFINAGNNHRSLRTITLNIDEDLLGRLDAMATDMGLNRTAFIVNSIAERLRQLSGK